MPGIRVPGPKKRKQVGDIDISVVVQICGARQIAQLELHKAGGRGRFNTAGRLDKRPEDDGVIPGANEARGREKKRGRESLFTFIFHPKPPAPDFRPRPPPLRRVNSRQALRMNSEEEDSVGRIVAIRQGLGTGD